MSLYFGALGCVFGSRLFAATQAQAGAAAFLNNGVGARALGMGGAYVAVADDATAEYWNPAALTRLGVYGTELASMYSSLSQDRAFNYLAFSQHFEGIGDLGLGFGQYAIQNIQAFDASGNLLGQVSDQEFRGSLSFARQINYQLRWGASLKLLHQELAGSDAWGYSCDFGLVALPVLGSDLALALNLQNPLSMLVWDTGYQDKVSPNLKVGFSDRYFDWHLVLAADLDIPVGVTGDITPHLGAEYWFDRSWALRTGLNNNTFAAGATWQYLFYEFDYAYTYNPGGLGDSHQFSVLLKF